MKEPNVKIIMGFFGKPIIDTKRLRINALFFFGAYVGNYSDGDAKRSHMAMLFASGGFFTILLAISLSLYLSGTMRIGDFLPFFPPSPIREGLFPEQLGPMNLFTVPWLSLSTPLDFVNMIIRYVRNLVPIFILLAFAPYAYPLKLHGKWHWNPSDGLWVLKFAFNKVSEKDLENASAAINENTDEKQEND